MTSAAPSPVTKTGLPALRQWAQVAGRVVAQPRPVEAMARSSATGFSGALGRAMAAAVPTTRTPASEAPRASAVPPTPGVGTDDAVASGKESPSVPHLAIHQPSGPGLAVTAEGTANVPTVSSPVPPASQPLPLSLFPRPADDNGRGIHWIPTVSSSPEVVDRFVGEAKAMNMRWAVVLNDGTQVGANDYLVKRLVASGIMPVMRIYAPGVQRIDGDLAAMVRHYRKLGVHYFQLFNEPNLRTENGGAEPDVDRYLDAWVPAARTVSQEGGLPGFGALAPGGDYDDVAFLRQALKRLRERGETGVLDRAWLAVHNYLMDRPADDPEEVGFRRYRRYDAVVRDVLGRSMPIIGTEGGVQIGSRLDEKQQADLLLQAYRAMERSEPYYFAYTVWTIANEAGGGHDRRWNQQALFRPDGVSMVVHQLKRWA